MDTTTFARDAGPAEDLAQSALTLARSFAAGATLWCVAPQWPAHGRHLAVEFVHPVIVGKRALSAVNLEGSDVTGALRLLSRPGDVVVVVGRGDDIATLDLMRRSQAWGLTRLWLGGGPRPSSDCTEHLVWLDGTDIDVAARSGEIVLLYHLLWELTHVVFEHPGLLETGPACTGEKCITCSDEGRIGEVRAVLTAGTAEVLVEGVPELVDVNLVDPVERGDLVLVHAGVALTVLDVPDGARGELVSNPSDGAAR